MWELTTDPTKTVTITLARGALNIETMAIQYNSSGTISNLTNKALTSCTGDGYEVELNDTSTVIVKVKTYRFESTYEILIQQNGIDFGTPSVLTKNKKLVEYVAIFLI